MNAAIKVVVFVFVVIGLAVGCYSPGHRQPPPPLVVTDMEEQAAQKYIDSQLRAGDSRADLLARFGPEDYQFKTEVNEVGMCFHFPSSYTNATAAGVGGFVGYFSTNRLVRWEPIYQR
jgi:hypothetical protein